MSEFYEVEENYFLIKFKIETHMTSAEDLKKFVNKQKLENYSQRSQKNDTVNKNISCSFQGCGIM
jgi:predicted double-glycine peptidase